ncbi:MAG: hypothetical protein ABGY96_15970 [bacterium]
MTDVQIVEFEDEDRTVCAEILKGLPEWFGIEEANRAYIEILGRILTLQKALNLCLSR